MLQQLLHDSVKVQWITLYMLYMSYRALRTALDCIFLIPSFRIEALNSRLAETLKIPNKHIFNKCTSVQNPRTTTTDTRTVKHNKA